MEISVSDLRLIHEALELSVTTTTTDPAGIVQLIRKQNAAHAITSRLLQSADPRQ